MLTIQTWNGLEKVQVRGQDDFYTMSDIEKHIEQLRNSAKRANLPKDTEEYNARFRAAIGW